MYNYYKFALFAFSILSIFFSTIYINQFRIDASSDTLVAQNDKDFRIFNNYQKDFPTKNNLVVAIKSQEEINLKLLKEIELISNKISKIQKVESVFSINKAPILFLNDTSLIDLSNNNYQTILNTNFKISEVLEEFKNSPIYRDQIINNEKNITSLIITLKSDNKIEDLKKNKEEYIKNKTYFKKKSLIDEERRNLIKEIRKTLNTADKEYKYFLGGVEMISSDVISFVKNDILVFSFVVLVLVILILFIIFKNIKWVFAILISSIFAVYNMIGVISFLNFEITAVSANFISLMFILSISMNIHILNNYLQTNNKIKNTLKIMFWPCLYTFLTTVVAFMSLIISDIKPVIDFGIVMIIALLVILITSFTILPLMISFFDKTYSQNIFTDNIINYFYKISKIFKKEILIFNFLILIISVYGLTKLNVENSFIKYFKKNTEIYQGMKLIDSELGGTTPLDIIIKFKNNEIIPTNNINDDEDVDGEVDFDEDFFSDDLFNNDNEVWFTENKINTIKKVHLYLENRPEVGKVTSIYSIINLADMINKNNLSIFELSVLYNEMPSNYKEDLIAPYLNINENKIKITARIKDSKNINRENLINDIKKFMNSFNNLEEVNVNGLLVLYNNMLSSLFDSQIKSLGFVLVAIFLMFIVLFKSIKLSVVGIIPNIFASTFILGLIGLLKIPLDIMTITIAAISIGIAVDNTIHYLYRYKINLSKDPDYIKSIENSHFNVGNAIITTSLAISLGFLTLCFSNFVPTIIFGLFTSLAMIFAMVGVLITLPSILYYIK